MNSVAKAIKDKRLPIPLIEKNFSEIMAFKRKHLSGPVEPFPLKKALEIINRPEHKEFAAAVASGDVSKFLQAEEEAD